MISQEPHYQDGLINITIPVNELPEEVSSPLFLSFNNIKKLNPYLIEHAELQKHIHRPDS